MKRSLLLLTVAATVVLSFALVACGGDGDGGGGGTTAGGAPAASRTGSAGTATDITFTTDGTTASGPQSTAAGWTKISLVNNGQGLAHLAFVKLNEGKTTADLVAAIQAQPNAHFPEWAVSVGGPGNVGPAGTSNATMKFEEGSYAHLRYVKGENFLSLPDASSVQPFTVAASTDLGTEPTPGTVITAFDFGYVINPARQSGVTLLAPIDAGAQFVRVDNQGPQVHEIHIVQLPEGKLTSDFPGWVLGQDRTRGGSPRVRVLPEGEEDGTGGPTGPPDGVAIGGVAALQAGQTVYFHMDLDQGTYFLYSSLVDSNTGYSQITRRNIHEFPVRAPLSR